MTVRLAPIRPHDLRAGDVLIDAKGVRWNITGRAVHPAGHEDGWWAQRTSGVWADTVILDVDIERTGPHRHWWLDSAVDRP